MNITICIPTYNRPESLARVLEHLLSFASTPAEIVIGDNSGTGSAEPVVASFRDRFPSLIYLRRNANVGVMRNLDSIMRVGAQPYIYVLSDDDFIYENALLMMQSVLQARSHVVAVNGSYDGTTKGVIGLNRDFSGVGVSIVGKGQFELLWNSIEVSDNFPLLRRLDFANYTQFRDLSCGLSPLLFDLLAHGDFVHMNAPVIQHEQRADSLSARIASQEITDMANGDLEVASTKANLLGYDSNTVRGRVVRNVYFQGARALFTNKKFLAGWHSLVRCSAYQGLGITTRVWAEKHLLPHVICEKLTQVAADTGCIEIVGDSEHINSHWLQSLNAQLAGLQQRVTPDPSNLRKMVLFAGGLDAAQSPNEVYFSLQSYVVQLGLSGYRLQADASGPALRMASADAEWTQMDESQEMQIVALRSPYA